MSPRSGLVPAPATNDLEDAWRQQKTAYSSPQLREGRIQSIDKRPDGALVSFVKERVPRVERSCRETGRVDRITSDGHVIYRRDCVVTKQGFEDVAPASRR